MNRLRKAVDIAGFLVARSPILSIVVTFWALYRMDDFSRNHPSYSYYGDLSVLPSVIFGLCGLIIGFVGAVLGDWRVVRRGFGTFAFSIILLVIAMIGSMRHMKFSFDYFNQRLAMRYLRR